jgi:hypothetical protein
MMQGSDSRAAGPGDAPVPLHEAVAAAAPLVEPAGAIGPAGAAALVAAAAIPLYSSWLHGRSQLYLEVLCSVGIVWAMWARPGAALASWQTHAEKDGANAAVNAEKQAPGSPRTDTADSSSDSSSQSGPVSPSASDGWMSPDATNEAGELSLQSSAVDTPAHMVILQKLIGGCFGCQAA